MPVKPRRPMGALPRHAQPSEDAVTAKKPVGRPKSAPSTIVNVRLPLTLVAALDRYLDQLEQQTGLKANRGMIARRALELFLASHASAATINQRGVMGGIVDNNRGLSHTSEDGRADCRT